MKTEIACFISPHGFGHATRTIAVLSALHQIIPDLQVKLFTTVPESLFKTCSFPYAYHRVTTDIGLVQNSALSTELHQTVEQLGRFIPLSEKTVRECAGLCRHCQLIICDISILGIAVGKRIGVKSLLIENFTWDWIYRHLAAKEPGLLSAVEYFSKRYSEADYRIQAEPLCNPVANDFTSPPIARRTIEEPAKVAELLGKRDRSLVLITMGGIPLELPFLDLLNHYPEYFFVLAGHHDDITCSDNVILLSHRTPFHHPDLIHAADLLICKSGYSTIAECSQTNTPICCVKRTGFAESAVLESWVTDRMNGIILYPDLFFTGRWLELLPTFIKRTRGAEPHNGDSRTAAFIATLL